LYWVLYKKRDKRTFIEALTSRRWISDIQGALSAGAIAEYLDPWASYQRWNCSGVENKHMAPFGFWAALDHMCL